MAKTVWLINEYGTVPENGYGGRIFYLAKNLSEMGFTVYFIVARNHHLLNIGLSNPKSKLVDGVNVISINSLNYSRSTSIKRILNWFIFNFQLLFINLVIKNRPSFILASSPSPFVGIPLIILSKIYSSKSCFDIRDVWPATLTALGNMSESSVAYKVMAWAERFSLKNADTITSNLPNFPLRIDEVLGKQKKFIWLPNGYDHKEMLASASGEVDFNHLIPKNRFLVGYVGSVGLANALEYFVESALLLKASRVFFLIVGEGEKLNELKAFAKRVELENILFLPKIAKNQVSGVMKRLDVCFIGWRVTKLYDYGIAPNKIPEYLISGKPVLHSFSGPNDPISLAGAGVTVRAEDPAAIADAILALEASSVDELEAMGARGRKYAISHYSYESIAQKLAEEIMA
jgi:glycosyltransferase involved in cell wall biosynthesis